jgi:hypothetical protein
LVRETHGHAHHEASKQAEIPAISQRDVFVRTSFTDHPRWRASAVGVYRLWRDFGYAIGALVAGITADVLGLAVAIWLIAALTFLSGLTPRAKSMMRSNGRGYLV